jgi:transposase InsO family protein
LSTPDSNKLIKNEIKSIFAEHKQRYGYRRVTLELRNRNYIVNHKKVKRLMKNIGLFAAKRRAKYKSYKGAIGKTAPNIIERNFHAEKPNQKWTTDISEFHIATGKLYLSPILDMYNREIVSFNVSRSPNFNQIIDMLEAGFKGKNLNNLIFHSDQGWQYQMYRYQVRLKSKGIIQSMSRKGNCLDNSIMENFFGVMKNEMFYGHEYEFETLEELENAIRDYIKYYNEKRITVKLKGLSPIQYRHQSCLIL